MVQDLNFNCSDFHMTPSYPTTSLSLGLYLRKIRGVDPGVPFPTIKRQAQHPFCSRTSSLILPPSRQRFSPGHQVLQIPSAILWLHIILTQKPILLEMSTCSKPPFLQCSWSRMSAIKQVHLFEGLHSHWVNQLVLQASFIWQRLTPYLYSCLHGPHPQSSCALWLVGSPTRKSEEGRKKKAVYLPGCQGFTGDGRSLN